MESQVEELSPVLIEVTLEVPWERVNKGLEEAYRTLQRTAKVRGFRPGKVPRSVVKKLMGKSVHDEVANNLAQESLGAAVEEHELQPVAVSEMKPEKITEGEPLKVIAKLEVRPKIEKVDTSGIAIKRPIYEVTGEAVDQEIQRLREQNSTLVTPAARPATKGDILTIDLKVSVGGEPRDDMNATDYKVEVGAGQLLEDMEKALEGMAPGTEKEVEVTFPEDYGREDLRNVTAAFVINAKELQEKQLPELDDEFAKDLEHDSLEAMGKTLREQLEKTAANRSEAQVREAAVDGLIDANPIAVPPSLAEQQFRGMLQEYMQFQKMMGMPPNFDEKIMEEMKKRAERKVQAGLLFGEIARTQKLEVTEEDLEAKYAEIAEQSGKHLAKVKADHQGEKKENLEAQVLEHKLLEYLLSEATITDSPADSEDKASESEPAEEKEP